MSSNRRDFIKFVVAGAIAAGCPLDLALLAEPAAAAPAVDGEDNLICHQVRDGHRFARPPVSARHDVVIVGGGISGLTAAYLLKNRDWLLLEKEPHWGGNAFLEEYQGNAYSTGAAFVESPPAAELARELGLEPLPISNWDGSILKGEFIPDTWGTGLDHLPYSESVRESFKKFRAAMLKVDVEKRRDELDNTAFSTFLRGYAPELKQWWDGYGPSNWGTLPEQTSALIAIGEIHGIAREDRKDERTTWPGGLGAISKTLSGRLQASHGERMMTAATTVAVVPQRREVHVTYSQGGQLKTVAAKGVIMASPKFITARLVEGLPQKQVAAMRAIRYAPYPVVNLIYNKPVFNKGYDTWCPGNAFTDFIVADWTIRNRPGYQPKYNILTCYTPMREDDRGYLLTEPGARQVAGRVLSDFQKLFSGSAVDPLEVHIYRRGHPMYMVTPGNYTRILPQVRQPMERVFFANTDSEGPVSTTSTGILAARRAVRELEGRLAGHPAPPREAAMAAGGY
jgi:protoporphyrinogen oxidase